MTNAAHKVSALLEIRREPDGQIPASLISAAYRASRSSSIMLALDSITPKEIDRVLDPVVETNGYHVRGVVYVDARDEAAIVVAAAASRVFASSQSFRARLRARGVSYQDVSRAESVLSRDSNEHP
jgi:hypothetical protein